MINISKLKKQFQSLIFANLYPNLVEKRWYMQDKVDKF